ncbi:MAG: FumA C-terminus/TtdB family hydratase beta subunit [Candidatus Saganbacteria bacterium]|nr:FumA C-terminus/TtdB family hydratase beta subunit [Candidatus Saganbacteria bacterium]
MKKITAPLTDKDMQGLHAGDQIVISGILYTARDAAHKKMAELIKGKKPLPFNAKGSIIFYAGPTPARPGKPIGAIGPTTAKRMDSFAPQLYAKGVKATLGKGARSKEVKAAIKKYRAAYFVATGGAAALLAKKVKTAKVIAYPELGTEAIYQIEVKDFPAIVAIDSKGGDIFNEKL